MDKFAGLESRGHLEPGRGEKPWVAGIAVHLPQVIAPVLEGLIVVGLGGYRPLFLFALGACVLGALCVVPIRSVR